MFCNNVFSYIKYDTKIQKQKLDFRLYQLNTYTQNTILVTGIILTE